MTSPRTARRRTSTIGAALRSLGERSRNPAEDGIRARVRALAPGPVRRADLAAFRWVAQRHLPVIGPVFPLLSRAANRSMLWLAIASVLAALGGRRGRRAALRGVLSIAATSSLTNLPGKHLVGRTRPEPGLIPEVRRSARVRSSPSFPSGHTASAAAFATPASLEALHLRVPLGGLAAAVGFSRVYTGVNYTADVVANVDAGNSLSGRRVRRLKALLPELEILQVEPFEDRDAAGPSCGGESSDPRRRRGDGSASTAARVAAEASTPLVLVPAGTLNHLAVDLGVEDVEATARAVREGRGVAMDLGDVNGRAFVNAINVGAYPRLAAEREKRERYLGRWLALGWAPVGALMTGTPVRVEVDGEARDVWSVSVGNGRYVGDGLVPTRRLRLDDGCLDVRVIDAGRPRSRLRIVAAALLGRVARGCLPAMVNGHHHDPVAGRAASVRL